MEKDKKEYLLIAQSFDEMQLLMATMVKCFKPQMHNFAVGDCEFIFSISHGLHQCNQYRIEHILRALFINEMIIYVEKELLYNYLEINVTRNCVYKFSISHKAVPYGLIGDHFENVLFWGGLSSKSILLRLPFISHYEIHSACIGIVRSQIHCISSIQSGISFVYTKISDEVAVQDYYELIVEKI